MSLIQQYQASFRDRNAYLSQEFTSGPVDWDDAPFKHTVRPGSFEVPLPAGAQLAERPAPGVSLASLAWALWHANGLLRRKLDVDWTKSAAVVNHGRASYARGTASGGGLYPVELYLFADGLAGLPNGIYHHCEVRSVLQRLRAGRCTPALAACWQGTARAGACYLVLTVRFWKNVFKYKNFGYQVVTEDVGAMLGTLLQVLAELGIGAQVRYQFADRMVAAAMGLDLDDEAPMAVLELVPDANGAVLADGGPWQGRAAAPLERSRRVAVPELIRQLHAATVLDDVPPPGAPEPWLPAGPHTALPAPAPLATDTELFIRRRSSMGRQSAAAGVSPAQLATLLAAAMAPYRADVLAQPAGPRAVRLAVFAQHVPGVTVGAYAYDPVAQALAEEGGTPDRTGNLQRIYYLENYNIAETALLVAVVARHDEAYAAWGERSLRICNAEAGMIAQRTYLAAARLGLSCGAALGFNCAEADSLFGLRRPAESIVMMLMISGLGAPSGFAARFDS